MIKKFVKSFDLAKITSEIFQAILSPSSSSTGSVATVQTPPREVWFTPDGSPLLAVPEEGSEVAPESSDRARGDMATFKPKIL